MRNKQAIVFYQIRFSLYFFLYNLDSVQNNELYRSDIYNVRRMSKYFVLYITGYENSTAVIYFGNSQSTVWQFCYHFVVYCLYSTPILLTKQESNFIHFGLHFSEEKVHHCYFLSQFHLRSEQPLKILNQRYCMMYSMIQTTERHGTTQWWRGMKSVP